MSGRNLIETEQKDGRETPIPRRVRHACDLLLSGEVGTIKAAAERVNLSREHLSRMLSRDHVRAYIARKTRENIAGLQMRAAAVLGSLLDRADSEHVKKDVALKVLALNGILPDGEGGVQVNVNVTPGYVIDLSGPDGKGPIIDGSQP